MSNPGKYDWDINAVPILRVIDLLDIKYQKMSDDKYVLLNKEGQEVSGWTVNTDPKQNCVLDSYKQNRAYGKPFNFIKSYLKFDNYQTFQWCRKHQDFLKNTG
ncbi:MAG: hypothetical protein WC606_05335 [Candidatus Absconditabacterales bacterium]